MKQQKRDEARRLRIGNGETTESISGIARLLSVSKGSVSRWVSDIKLTESQKNYLMTRPGHPGENSASASEIARINALEDRMKWFNIGRSEADTGNWLHLAGCMLYWAEGSKSRNNVVFSNSDASMASLFLRFIREFEMTSSRINVEIYLHRGLSESSSIAWWSKHLKIKRGEFKIRPVDQKSSKGSAKRLNYGIIRIEIHDTRCASRIYGSISEYGSCDMSHLVTAPLG